MPLDFICLPGCCRTIGRNPYDKKKRTFKDKREFEILEKEIASLNKEKSNITELLSTGNLVFEELQKPSHRIGKINQELDIREMRWLE